MYINAARRMSKV